MSDQPAILVVDDEPDLRDLLAFNLQRAGCEPLTAADGVEALRVVEQRLPDLVLLDQMMPRLSGTEVLARWRRDPRTARLPVIMLTARAAERDQVHGLAAGADDYVVKPFSLPVLMARIQAALRRGARQRGERGQRVVGPLRIDFDARRVWVEDRELQLTATEHRLLAALADPPGTARSRVDLIQRAIGPGVRVTARTIDVHMASLRRKLGQGASLIETVRGFGYRLASPEGAATPAGDQAP